MFFKELPALCFPRGLEGQVSCSPFLPADMAWSRAARNWSCRSSSDPTAMGCDEDRAAGEPKYQEAPAEHQQDFQEGFRGGVQGNTSDKVTVLIFRLENP